MNVNVFDYPTLVWRPLSRKPLRISAQTLCHQKLDSMAYIFVADSMGLSSFIFCGGLRKTHLLCNRMRIGRSRSSKVVDFGTNRKGVCDFLLATWSYLAPFLRYGELLAENCEFFLSHPCLTPHSGGTRQNFRMKLSAQKLEGWDYCIVKIARY